MNSTRPGDFFSDLRSRARASLVANIVTVEDRQYLAAGGHQFGSFWTRDFSFAVRGLISIGRADVAIEHVSHLLRHLRDDGLVPRILDYMPSWKRVVAHTALRALPRRLKTFSPDAPLKAEHVGEHGTLSIDSNALILIAAQSLVRAEPETVGRAWLATYRSALQRGLDFCLARTQNARELVVQGRYEDWQDSASREGRTLYVNALYAMAFAAARDLGLTIEIDAPGFLEKIRATFYDEAAGVYKACETLDIVSLDGNLLILNEPALAGLRTPDLYARLKTHALWTSARIPGVATVGDYPESWISWTTRAVGLRHYHDRFAWSWLAGLAAKAARLADDEEEARRIWTELQRMAIRDDGIGEIYESRRSSVGPDDRELVLVRRLLYRSELPFSWGAGCILESLDDRRL